MRFSGRLIGDPGLQFTEDYAIGMAVLARWRFLIDFERNEVELFRSMKPTSSALCCEYLFLRLEPRAAGVGLVLVDAPPVNSLPAKVGLRKGDVIEAVNGNELVGARSSNALLRALVFPKRSAIELRVSRSGKPGREILLAP